MDWAVREIRQRLWKSLDLSPALLVVEMTQAAVASNELSVRGLA